jgi:hypothetical protein
MTSSRRFRSGTECELSDTQPAIPHISFSHSLTAQICPGPPRFGVLHNSPPTACHAFRRLISLRGRRAPNRHARLEFARGCVTLRTGLRRRGGLCSWMHSGAQRSLFSMPQRPRGPQAASGPMCVFRRQIASRFRRCQRARQIVRPPVDIEHVRHRGDKRGVGFRRDDPVVGQARFGIVFLERAADRIEVRGRGDFALDTVLRQQTDRPARVTGIWFRAGQRGQLR